MTPRNNVQSRRLPDPWLAESEPPAPFDIRVRSRFETAIEAENRRDRLAKVLSTGQPEHGRLAHLMGRCYLQEPCEVSSDPICQRLFRINLVWKAAEYLWTPFLTGELFAATVVLPDDQFAKGHLTDASLQRYDHKLRNVFRKAGLDGAKIIGGKEYSFNTGLTTEGFWQLHAHVVISTPNHDKDTIRRMLEPFAPESENVPSPLHVTRVTELLGALSYLFKPFADRRVSYIDKNGRWNTRAGTIPLKPEQLREWAIALATEKIAKRLFLFGVRRRGENLADS